MIPIVLDVAAGWDGTTLLNTAEISPFDNDTDPGNGDSAATPLDFPELDSTPDTDNSDVLVDDEIDSNPTGVPADEDDHDVASVPVMDLALIKTRSAGQTLVIDPTAPVFFDITVKNQGQTDATDIQVADNIPAGMAYAGATVPAGVTDNADGTFVIDTLAAGDDVTFTIEFSVVGVTDRYVNGAEITQFDDADPSTPTSSDPGGPVDIDSVADTDPTNDAITLNGLRDGEDSHNNIDNDRDASGAPVATPENEDDHDTEVVLYPFDLALRKTVDVGSFDAPLLPGDTVTFTVEILNQGVKSVDQIDVVDYIDDSMWDTFAVAANPDGVAGDAITAGFTSPTNDVTFTWTAADGFAPLVTLTGRIRPSEAVTIPVTLAVRGDLDTAGQLSNVAEISRYDNDADPTNGDSATEAIRFVDIDSTPDTDNTDVLVDDEIDSSPTGVPADEDDHDIAPVALEIFDLALDKRIVDVDIVPVVPGTTKVTFEIEVFNQGTTPAFAVEVTDDVQVGFVFETADNADWVGADGADLVTTTIDGPIAPGDSEIVSLVLLIAADAGQARELLNFAEISAADDDLDPANTPPIDFDSVPDQNPDELADGEYEDGVRDEGPGRDTNDNGIFDEDDHDGAVITLPVFDLDHRGSGHERHRSRRRRLHS